MTNKIPESWGVFPDSEPSVIVESAPVEIVKPTLNPKTVGIMNQCRHTGCGCNNGKTSAGVHLFDCWCNYCEWWMQKQGFNRDWSSA